jgi:hypothetical protein
MVAGTACEDDRSIADQAALWRLIHPNWIVQDDNERGWRISSAAFDDSKDGSPLSVLLAEVIASTGRTADDLLAQFTGYGLAAITAGSARAQRQGVSRTPRPNEPAHASVFGKKTGSVKRALARAANWVHLPK